MSDEPMKLNVPTSPDLATNDGIMKTQRQLSNALTLELTDAEIQQLFRVIVPVQSKWKDRPNTSSNLEEMRDEIVTKCAEIGVLVSVDPTPCFYGEPPIVDIIGKVAGDPIHKHGFDHERKEWEVRRATERNEDYLGQKGK